ncbi:type I DNA topoisomerase [Dysgonomonas sp. 25]|uniref:type I DNA topoisomerase n=1 Tax=Dysgonomonas sp. 25 TaxID=2302933 RepID=UPI0013D63B3E|nr:type I DNA topoisomerase [Dysgonomonas sp. 25]NDV69564.1 type I DNA topoisomerase [Dysgonomonas sp. 25]
MQKNLVIVESPAKAKTIEKFLGKDFKVMSSYGHIRDLKKKDLGIDINHNFTPVYEVPADKKKVVDELKKAAKNAETVWLASDEDREGEAISWHLYQALGLDKKDTKRIAFHEITKDAILHAIENPRQIDNNLVDAQQARRVLDRIVGFELSPILWKKIKPSLSAGRVQSVAVRLIVEREKEIMAFTAEASYRVVAIFTKEENGTKYEIKAELNKRLKTKEEALAFLEKLKEATFTVEKVETKPVKKSPAPPFTTSTLQQEASRKLSFPVSLTMMIAQKLYESGKITYMRTDSVNLSALAINTSRNAIESLYGKEYSKPRKFTTKAKGAQEAHEAIRPTYMEQQTVTGTAQEKKLYELIWKRTAASQMADAELDRTTVTIGISTNDMYFSVSGEVLKFDGFLRLYMESSDEDETVDEEAAANMLPPMKKAELLDMKETTATERFTQKPPRYSEAALVRKMEELGIGRPSTYAPTISTILNREYVEKSQLDGTERQYDVLTLSKGKVSEKVKTEITGADKNKLIPTDIGFVVNDFLQEFFPNILDYNFTANVEQEFDQIAEGKEDWTKTIGDFYKKFHPVVEATNNIQTEHKVGERVLGTDPETGRQVSVRIGRFGPMVQIGTSEDEEKPKFASLGKNQSITTISLDEALKLFDMPRKLGEYEGKEVTIGIGRFGPYAKHNNLFASLPKEIDPYAITLEEAIPIIEDKKKKEAEKLIKTFDENEGVKILKGRWGPYIAYNKKSYRLPKDADPLTLSYDDCMKIIGPEEKKKTKSTTKAKSTTTKKKTAAKTKSTTKKSTATKSTKKSTATKKKANEK